MRVKLAIGEGEKAKKSWRGRGDLNNRASTAHAEAMAVVFKDEPALLPQTQVQLVRSPGI
jgi:hypothetical protein